MHSRFPPPSPTALHTRERLNGAALDDPNTQVFMEPSDFGLIEEGKVEFIWGQLRLDTRFFAPPDTGFYIRDSAEPNPLGNFVIGAFEIEPGLFELLVSVVESPIRSESESATPQRLVRYTTADFRQYSTPETVLVFPPGVRWLGHKELARRPDTGERLLLAWGGLGPRGSGGLAAFCFQSPDGRSWTPLHTTEPAFRDLDAGGLVWDRERNEWLQVQVTFQRYAKPYPDNFGNQVRRVVMHRRSRDGRDWMPRENRWYKDLDSLSSDCALFTPDDADPRDLEFYSLGAFRYVDRYVGILTPYAAVPNGGVLDNGHGPWLSNEWVMSKDLGRVEAWNRVARQTPAGPPEFHMPRRHHQPLVFEDRIVWVQGFHAYTLPLLRVAGAFARTNAIVRTRPFTAPKRALFLNADTRWNRAAFLLNRCTPRPRIWVEVCDTAGHTIPGFERQFCVIEDLDELRIPLTWDGREVAELSGEKITLRLHLHHATVYSLWEG